MIAVSFGKTHKKNQGFLILVIEYETLSGFSVTLFNFSILKLFFIFHNTTDYRYISHNSTNI